MKVKQTDMLLLSFTLGSPWLLVFLQWSWVQIVILSLGLTLGGWGYRYVSIKANIESLLKQKQQHLLSAYRLIKVLVMQGQSPYQALVTVLPFVDQTIADAFHQLLLGIDQDKSIHPYLQFANQFQSLMIEQLLFALYQLENQGGDARHFQQFQYLFDQAEQQHYQHEVEQFHEHMQQQNQWVMVATGLIAISLLLGVMTLIGGMIRGV